MAEGGGHSIDSGSGSSSSDTETEAAMLSMPPLTRAWLAAAEAGDISALESMLDATATTTTPTTTSTTTPTTTPSTTSHLVGLSDPDGYTALHRAAYEGHVATVQWLVRHGARLELTTQNGWTPLHSAVRWNHVGVTRFLLAAGAHVNAATNGGQRPLHLAATQAKGRATCMALLERADVDPFVINDAGDTPLQLAERSVSWAAAFRDAVAPALGLGPPPEPVRKRLAQERCKI